jgi:hypothetical protein
VLARQRDEGVRAGPQHEGGAVGVLAAGLAHQGQDLLGAAAGGPDDLGLDRQDRRGHRRNLIRNRSRNGPEQRFGDAADAQRRVDGAGLDQERREAFSLVQR